MSTHGQARHSGCPDASDMAAWLDGILEGPEKARFARHLAGCRKCRLALDELGLLLSLGPVDPGRECLARGKALVGAAGALPAVCQAGNGRSVPARFN